MYKRIGLFTSGGDSSGMNAAIRAVVRTASTYGIEVLGIHRGWQGLIEGDIAPLAQKDVSRILALGGTILGTARSEAFRTVEGRRMAAENMRTHNVEALIAIGGDGTFAGAIEFYKEFQFPTVGLPGTIDNDISGTEFTIGFDTAVNVAMEAIDRVRDTAESHQRIFIVEVMGRHAGWIALFSGLATGADEILIPETPTDFEHIHEHIADRVDAGKTSHILVVCEGDEAGNAYDVAKNLRERFDCEAKVCVLGHIQRGGSPTARDRLLALRLGVAAVDALVEGKINGMVGEIGNRMVYTPFSEVRSGLQVSDPLWFRMAQIMG